MQGETELTVPNILDVGILYYLSKITAQTPTDGIHTWVFCDGHGSQQTPDSQRRGVNIPEGVGLYAMLKLN